MPGEFSTLQTRDPYGLSAEVLESIANPTPTVMNRLVPPIPRRTKPEVTKEGNQTATGE